MNINKEIKNNNRREFLLKFFKQDMDHNETMEMNGFILFKHWNGDGKFWTVDVFTPESYRSMKEHRPKIQEERLF